MSLPNPAWLWSGNVVSHMAGQRHSHGAVSRIIPTRGGQQAVQFQARVSWNELRAMWETTFPRFTHAGLGKD